MSDSPYELVSNELKNGYFVPLLQDIALSPPRASGDNFAPPDALDSFMVASDSRKTGFHFFARRSSTPINAVFAHNRQLAPKVRALIDFLVERLKTLEF